MARKEPLNPSTCFWFAMSTRVILVPKTILSNTLTLKIPHTFLKTYSEKRAMACILREPTQKVSIPSMAAGSFHHPAISPIALPISIINRNLLECLESIKSLLDSSKLFSCSKYLENWTENNWLQNILAWTRHYSKNVYYPPIIKWNVLGNNRNSYKCSKANKNYTRAKSRKKLFMVQMDEWLSVRGSRVNNFTSFVAFPYSLDVYFYCPFY